MSLLPGVGLTRAAVLLSDPQAGVIYTNELPSIV